MSETSVGTLTVYQRMNDPLEAVKVMGNAIAKSGMFGCSSVESGQVFAMECLHRNMPPLTIAQRYHVIFGKLSMKAEAMLAGFEQEGGTYKVLSRTPELVSIEMTPPGGKAEVLSLSWDEAQKEPFVYEGKEDAIVDLLMVGKKPKLKPKYATPRSRMQMLWARLVSDSVRFLCPKVVCGVYTPEENEDIRDEEIARANGNGQHKTTVASAGIVEQVAAVPTAKEIVSGPAVDTEFEVKKPEQNPLGHFATPGQCELIVDLFIELRMTADQQTAALAKRKASSIRNLTATVADELIAVLKSKLAAIRDAKLPQLDPASSPDGATCGPCTPEQERAIKVKFEEWKQIDREACDKAIVGFKQKLFDSGRQKIADLSASDATRLAAAIDVRKLDSFFQRSLETWKPLDKAAGEPATEQKTAA